MITTVITLLILALVLYLIWIVIGQFVKGQAHQIIGIILALILVLYALQVIGVLPSLHR